MFFEIFLMCHLDRADFENIQRRLERKLGESKAAHSELRLVMRENRELEQQNLRLSHRVAFLEDHCSSLTRGLRSVAVSVSACLNPPGPPAERPPSSSTASSGVSSLSDSPSLSLSLSEKSSLR